MKKFSFDEYIEVLKSTKPAPGGGSANAKVLEIAIALALKAINISKARKSFLALDKNIQREVENNVKKLDKSFKLLEKLAENDQKAFEGFMKVYKLNDEKKTKDALVNCFNVPFSLYEEAKNSLVLIYSFKDYIVKSITSDFKMSLEIFKSVFNNSLFNLKINADLLDKEYEDLYKKVKTEVANLNKDIDKVLKEIK